jgi:hypothetical protein
MSKNTASNYLLLSDYTPYLSLSLCCNMGANLALTWGHCAPYPCTKIPITFLKLASSSGTLDRVAESQNCSKWTPTASGLSEHNLQKPTKAEVFSGLSLIRTSASINCLQKCERCGATRFGEQSPSLPSVIAVFSISEICACLLSSVGTIRESIAVIYGSIPDSKLTRITVLQRYFACRPRSVVTRGCIARR